MMTWHHCSINPIIDDEMNLWIKHLFLNSSFDVYSEWKFSVQTLFPLSLLPHYDANSKSTVSVSQEIIFRKHYVCMYAWLTTYRLSIELQTKNGHLLWLKRTHESHKVRHAFQEQSPYSRPSRPNWGVTSFYLRKFIAPQRSERILFTAWPFDSIVVA